MVYISVDDIVFWCFDVWFEEKFVGGILSSEVCRYWCCVRIRNVDVWIFGDVDGSYREYIGII